MVVPHSRGGRRHPPLKRGVVPTGTVAIADAASGSPICSAVLAANPDGSATGSCSPTDDQFPSGTALTSVTATSGGDGSDLASLSAGDRHLPVTDP